MLTKLKFPMLVIATMFTFSGNLAAQNNDESKPWMAGYACCNLRYFKGEGWVGDGNNLGPAFINAGTFIKVEQPTRKYRVRAEANGQTFWFGQDQTHEIQSLENWLKDLITKENPQDKINQWPDNIQLKIYSGTITKGMTKEQALIALGPPPKNLNPSLNQAFWIYQFNQANQSDDEFVIYFKENKVSKIQIRTKALPKISDASEVEVEWK